MTLASRGGFLFSDGVVSIGCAPLLPYIRRNIFDTEKHCAKRGQSLHESNARVQWVSVKKKSFLGEEKVPECSGESRKQTARKENYMAHY